MSAAIKRLVEGGKPFPETQATIQPKKRSSYLPTLDGWRAFAVLIVLLDHSPTMHLWRFSTEHFHVLDAFAVDLFFAISGLLICSRLLDEESLTGELHLKGFYIRRVLRIQPAALLMLAVVAVLTVLHCLPPFTAGLVASLLLVRNYIGNEPGLDASWPTAHFWSLSVEEHFYLFLPTFLRVVKKGRATILLSLAALDFGWRAWVTAHSHAMPFQIITRSDVRAEMLLLPAALALLLRRPAFKQQMIRLMSPMLVLMVLMMAMPEKSPIHLAMLLLPTALVVSTVLNPQTWVGTLLELAPVRYIGRISYGLYLWQELFLSQHFAPGLHPFGVLTQPWLTWPAVFACAIASYHLVELPCMRLGHKLARPATPGRPSLEKGLPAHVPERVRYIPSTPRPVRRPPVPLPDSGYAPSMPLAFARDVQGGQARKTNHERPKL
ncbi:acyltransferase [Acidipila sp. EB88]|uniref:acyltransferase family protein n=1 Tax=Acidipila sp. EB88 TaxID=2305226 RepID=UPI000F5FDD1C|nr:acyltransferase [Acidipila sp. EB88]RRA48565.1 acyltransferase [Acidipila sp. EB88]